MSANSPPPWTDALDRLRHAIGSSGALRYIVAAVWAVMVGSLMACFAWLLDVPSSEWWLIGALGGAGAAAFVLLFATSA